MRAAAIPLLVCTLCASCSEGPSPARRREPLPPPPHAIADAGAWATRIAPASSSAKGAARSAGSVHLPRAAVMGDEVEASDETVFAGRLVYRVSFAVPPSFRDHRAVVQAPAGELHIDVSMNRLRARLLGPGWPVDEGAEIRLRSDLPGVYLFDGRGGRALGAGQLAAWFEGREGQRAQAGVGVRREYGPAPELQRPVPGQLVCALLAEWGHQKREPMLHRCDVGTLPPGFHVGPWSGELTAVVPMQLPRRTLRADEHEPPARVPIRTARALLEPSVIAKLQPARPVDAPAPAQLSVENRTETRAIVLAQGVAVGWLDAGQTLVIDGFAPGYYRIGAVRPLGIMRTPPRLVRVPGALVLGVDRDAGVPEPEPEP